jgi:YVTN family beta-propeller protein
MDTLQDGTIALGRLEESKPTGQFSVSDSNGDFTVAIPGASEYSILAAVVTAPGFSPKTDVCVIPHEGGRASVLMSLTPLNIGEEEVERIRNHSSQLAEEQKLAESATLGSGKSVEELMTSNIACPSPEDVPDYVWVSPPGITMALDEYVTGVIQAEVDGDDGFPYEALKAQSVASRTVALRLFLANGNARGGQAWTSQWDINGVSRNASRATSKVLICYQNQLTNPLYSARCNGDFTQSYDQGICLNGCASGNPPTGCNDFYSGSVPYLLSKPCSGHKKCSDPSVNDPWCCKGIFVGGRYVDLYGHGIGLCQRGAEEFAKRDCRDWLWILNNFYTGVQIVNARDLIVGDRVSCIANLNVRSAACGAIVTTVGQSTVGTIASTPQYSTCSGRCWRWWKINWDNGASGWSVEDYLKRETSCQQFTKSYSPGLNFTSLPLDPAPCGSCAPSAVIAGNPAFVLCWDCTNTLNCTPSCLSGGGKAYVIGVKSGLSASINMLGMPPALQGGALPLDICYGFTLLGSPFTAGTNWTRTEVEYNGNRVSLVTAVNSGWIYPDLYVYDASLNNFTVSSTLAAGAAAFVFARVSGLKLWLYPNGSSQNSAQESPEANRQPDATESALDWQFSFRAQAGSLYDNSSYLGVGSTATDGCDPLLEELDLDFACALSTDGCMRVFFTPGCSDFTDRNRDLRAPLATGEAKSWTASVKSKFPSAVSPVTLSWPEIGQVPAGYTVILNPGSLNIDMRTQASYQYTPSSLEETRLFTIQVTDQSCSPPGQPGFTGADSLCGPESDIFIFHAYSNDATSWNWTSSCGGIFTDPTSEITHWTAPAGFAGLCQFTVTASNSCGTSEPAVHNVLVKQAPSAVAIGQLAGVCSTGVTLSATAANNPTSWNWRSTCGGTFSPPAAAQTVWTAPNDFVGPCLITAIAANACGVDSNAISIDCGCAEGSPPTPTGLTATPGCDHVDLVWHSSGNAAYYWIWRAGYFTMSTDTSFRDSHTDPNHPDYMVAAVNPCGQSAFSDSVRGVADTTCPLVCGNWYVDTTIAIPSAAGIPRWGVVWGNSLILTRAFGSVVSYQLPDFATSTELSLQFLGSHIQPFMMTSSTDSIYVSVQHNGASGWLIGLKAEDLTLFDSVSLGPNPRDLALQDGQVFVTCDPNKVLVFSASDLNPLGNVTVGSTPVFLCIDSASGKGFVSTTRGVDILNTQSGTFLSTIPLGAPIPGYPIVPSGIAKLGEKLYVATTNSSVGRVYVIDCATNAVQYSIPVGNSPFQVTAAFGKIFVANGAPYVDVIDPDSKEVVQSLKVGNGLQDIISDPVRGLIYVVNGQDQTVSVLRQVGILESPILLSPTNGEGDVLQPLFLEWQLVDGAQSYNVETDDDQSFSSPNQMLNVLTDTLPLDSLVPMSTVFWRVRASNQCGEGAWSEISYFSVAPCACDCDADPQCDSVTNILDVVRCINVAFRDGAALADPDPFCPRFTTDVDCSGATDILDVVHLIDVAFRDGDPATEFCQVCLGGVGVGVTPTSTRPRPQR